MNANLEFHEAIHQQSAWKNVELYRFAVKLVAEALKTPDRFTTDIVPDEYRGFGLGIAGSAIGVLQSASIVEGVGWTAPDGSWQQAREKSKRASRNGVFINVYRLTSVPLAKAFLDRHGVALKEHMKQVGFFGELTQPAAIPENIQNLGVQTAESSQLLGTGGQPGSFLSATD